MSQGSQRFVFHQSSQWLSTIKTECEQSSKPQEENMFTQHIQEESMDEVVSLPERSLGKYLCSHLLMPLASPVVLPILAPTQLHPGTTQ